MDGSPARWWHRYVPAHIGNPFPLAYRLLTSEGPAARSAVFVAAAGALLTPVDVLLQRAEAKEYANAAPPKKPIVLVCGPPRSGTTLLAQYLINTFDVCYLNNLTAMFPRAPVTANRRLGRLAPLRPGTYSAYYGKSRGLSGANDALYVWDRWLGSNRHAVPQALEPGSETTMPAFFGAVQSLYELPLVNKVNRLNTCADLVAARLGGSQFYCVHRDPLMLAQSLLLARREIVGEMKTAYGVQHPNPHPDPVEDVCRQVAFHENHSRRQQDLLGEKRFSIVSYEEFCRRPAALAETIAADVGGLEPRDMEPGDMAPGDMEPGDMEPGNPEPGNMEPGKMEPGNRGMPRAQAFEVSVAPRLPAEILERMRRRLEDLGAGRLNFRRF